MIAAEAIVGVRGARRRQPGRTTGRGGVAALAAALGVFATLAFPTMAGAAQILVDFEPAGYVPGGSVQALAPDGTTVSPIVTGTNPSVQAWSIRNAATDEEVVSVGGAHGKVWRLSDLGDTGNLQTRPHSPNGGFQAGETGAIDDFGANPVTSSTFFGQFDFRSATGAAQNGLQMNVHGACGDDCRHGFVRIIDDGAGFDLGVFHTGINGFSEFVFTTLDLNLSYTDWHTLGIAITFFDGLNGDGTGNDIVEIFANGTSVLTTTSWETGYDDVGTGAPRSIDRLAFYRNSNGEASVGGGLYFDNVLVSDTIPLASVAEPSSLLLLGMAIAGGGLLRSRRRRASR